MGIKHCYSKGSNNRCLECEEGYGLFGDEYKNGFSKCVKCGKYCNYCFRKECIQCKCGYKQNPNNSFECIKPNLLLTNNLNENEDCNDADHFIRVNIILLLLIIILMFKIH